MLTLLCNSVLPKFSSKTTQLVAKNTIYQLIGKLVSLTITITATWIITRNYGRTGYGEFNLMQAFPAFFFIIVDFGINAIAVRELAADWNSAQKYLGNILVLRVLMSLLLIIVSASAIYFMPYSNDLKFGIYLSLFLILTQALYSTTNIIFQVKLRYDYSTLGYVIGSLVVLALVLYLSSINASIALVNFSYVIGGVVTFLINIFYIKKLNLNTNLSFDKSLIKHLLIQTLPLGLMFIFSQINFKADTILLSALPLPKDLGLSSTDTVALYGLPYKIFEVALVIPTFVMNAVFPILVMHLALGKDKLLDTFRNVIIVLTVGGLIAGVIGVLLSPFMIKVLGGSEFKESVLVLQILLSGIVIFFISQPISWLIVTLKGQKLLPIIYLIGAIVNLMGNIYFIPKYSFMASAILTWVSEIIILILLIILALKVWNEYFKTQS